MPGLNLFTSNRLEVLSARLADILRFPLPSPLAPELIVVQSKGMEKWLRMELARRQGVAANLVFPFPNRMVAELSKVVLGLEEAEAFSNPHQLTWKVMDSLLHCIEKPGFETLKRYLGGQNKELKLYQLCSRIAYLYDQYLVYRPEMILSWEKGEGDHSQAELWRQVVRGAQVLHKARLRQLLLQALKESPPTGKRLPQRISVFGISTLPPYHMEILAALARQVEVNIFVLNPCKEYWADIVPKRGISAIHRKEEGIQADPDMLHLETGNRLLASMGRLGRDFQQIALDLDPVEHHEFVDFQPQSLLTHIQHHILNLHQPSPEEKIAVDEGDRSIEIHSCHSPMREMEVLRDNLLALFDHNPHLLPKDIVVMAPDIELYTPYIQAVFGAQEDNHYRIPFTIADRSLGHEGELGRTLLKLLTLHQTRFKASQVLDLLEAKAVREKFHISEQELSTIRGWVANAGIRWGIDESYREKEGLPGVRENTWAFGLDRMLLGYALPEDPGRPFQGILPFERAGVTDPELLGRFSEFVHTIFRHYHDLQGKKGLGWWAEKLQDLLDDLMAPDEGSVEEYHRLREIFAGLAAQEREGFHQEVGIHVLVQHLEERLEGQGLGYGFLNGAVTFCALLPMRSIPFKVVCLVGMNYDAFPRRGKTLQFDLMARHPRRGDRSRREDDRYLFLEAMVSAREKLYISYVGQSMKDNSPSPPSALVSELADYIQDCFVVRDDEGNEKPPDVMVFHRLQPFSPAYFLPDSPLFSYSTEDLEGAKALVGERVVEGFAPHELLPTEEELKQITVHDLVEFFKNPAKFFFRRRLGIRLPEEDTLVEDQEPITLSGLEQFHLEQFLHEQLLKGGDFEEIYSVTKATGVLPHGSQGRVAAGTHSCEVKEFLERLAPFQQNPELDPVEIDLEVGGVTIQGRLGGIQPGFRLAWRLGKLRAEDQMGAWVEHLLLNIASKEGYPRETVVVAKDKKVVTFSPVEEADSLFQELVEIYLSGLVKPIPFFPKTSLHYARSVSKGTEPELALQRARSVWLGGQFSRGEVEGPYFKICFQGQDPLDQEFHEVALKICLPMIQHMS